MTVRWILRLLLSLSIVTMAMATSCSSQAAALDAVPDADPVLQRFPGATPIAMTDDWSLAADAPAILASGFAPAHVREAAILVTLNPGAYTAIVSGAGGTTGIGLVEVFAR